jgi:membrane protease YdiL (CAAX protease family)
LKFENHLYLSLEWKRGERASVLRFLLNDFFHVRILFHGLNLYSLSFPLILALHAVNRLVVLPQQQLPDLAQVPQATVLSLLLMAAPVAGIVEEAAFRGYMQGPVERRYGLILAILITGTMFAIAHLDFTLILWPYYLAVTAIYGTVTYLTKSILPAVALHMGGNIYSNLELWLHGQAEWQSSLSPAALIWKSGADVLFWMYSIALLIVAAAMVWAYFKLARVALQKT